MVQQPTNNALKQLFQDLNKAKELSNEDVSQAVKRNEDKILEIGKLFQQRGDAESLGQLVKMVRPYLGSLSKAKAAKLVRQLVDLFLDMESAVGLEVDLCKECIEWARQEKRNYLRQGPGLYCKHSNLGFSKIYSVQIHKKPIFSIGSQTYVTVL